MSSNQLSIFNDNSSLEILNRAKSLLDFSTMILDDKRAKKANDDKQDIKSKQSSKPIHDTNWIEELFNWAYLMDIPYHNWYENSDWDDNGYFNGLPRNKLDLLNLSSLRIAYTNIAYLNDNIFNLRNLKQLHLHHNRLLEIPSYIKELSSVEVLNIEHNRLDTIPLEIYQLSNLKELYLDNNNIIHIDKEIKNLQNLEVLYLGANQIPKLPFELTLLPNLKVLNIMNLPNMMLGNYHHTLFQKLQANGTQVIR